MPDSTLATLDKIRIKVRKLVRSPSSSQISDADIDSYINTFVLYDFPEHLRQFYLRTTFTFYTQPNIDTYETNTTVPTDPLYNFKNLYISTHGPLYIAGMPSYYTQSREQFFVIYPKYSSVESIGSKGNGITVHFAGTLSAKPILNNDVTFSSVDINGNGLSLKDVPIAGTTTGLLVTTDTGALAGTIDYISGVYDFTFLVAPANGVAINSQTVPYVASRPQGVCFFQGTFILRPVPDQPYPVNIEVYRRPTELLTDAQLPELAEWWQYIAYGAAKKILEDRMDPDTVQILMPEFKQQEALILRRSLVQQSNERVATIYTEQTSLGAMGNGLGWGGGNF